jgi:hypothetical protein
MNMGLVLELRTSEIEVDSSLKEDIGISHAFYSIENLMQ